MSRMYKKLAVLSILVLLLSGCGTLFGRSAEQEAPTPTPIPTPIVPDKPSYVVQRGQVVKQIEFTARISAIEEETLYFKTNGYVKRVLVERDDVVQSGDLLAELEIDDLLKQMAQAEVALNSAQLRLNDAQTTLERQISQADLNLTAAQARLTQAENANADAIAQAQLSLAVAQEQLARLQLRQVDLSAEVTSTRIGLVQAQDGLSDAQTEYQEALDRDWEPEEVRDAYARGLEHAEWGQEIAQARYDQALAAQQGYGHDLTVQELAVAQVEATLAQLQRGVDLLLGIDVQRAGQERSWLDEGVDPVMVNEVNQAQLALERLQAQVADAQILAPMDGAVLLVSLRPGRMAEAFEGVIVIADPEGIEVSADLSDTQMEEMVEGQEALVSLTAHPGQTWRGIVRRLPYPFGSGGGTQTLDEIDKSSRITLKGDLGDLDLGDLARVLIVLEEKNDVLWLPPEAIRTFQGREFVIVQGDERQRRVDVQIGIESRDRVEILQGLEQDQVIVGQ